MDTIHQSDLLVALLDGAHPDVLVDISIAYALGVDCYGLQIHRGRLDCTLACSTDSPHHSRTPRDSSGHLRLDTDVGISREAVAELGNHAAMR